MEPTSASPEQHNSGAMPPRVVQRSNFLAGMLARTSVAFTAEYVVFLIALGIVLSNVAGLVYVFFGLIVDTMHGGAVSPYTAANIFVLWLVVSSVIAVPTAGVLWSRVQGELAANNEYKGQLPKGAARGFRTFWMTLNALGILGILMVAVFAPLAALVGGAGGVEALLAVTLPSLINVVILAVGLYAVTRRVDERSKVRLLMLVIAGLTAVLFTANFIWASNIQPATPSYPHIYQDPIQRYDDCPYCSVGQ